jgi:SAM-dependent methyltransferase
VGGVASYWRQVGFDEQPDIHITLLNLKAEPVSGRQFAALAGDGRHMPQFADSSFDIVYSNSVIEHVGTPEEQRRLASEILRVGIAYFVQTPNRWFPVEPHYFAPFIHWLPQRPRVWAARYAAFQPTAHGMRRVRATPAFLEEVASIRLLTRREFAALFPGSAIWTERVFGLAKSFVAYGRWEQIRKDSRS